MYAGVVVCHKAVPIWIHCFKERKQGLLNDGYVQRGIHYPLKNADSSLSSLADAGPNMDLDWMLCPIIQRILHVSTVGYNYLHIYMYTCICSCTLVWSWWFSLLPATKPPVGFELHRAFIGPHYVIESVM